MKRLPAFTLMEVLLSLLLLGLVGGMAAYIVQFLGRGGLQAGVRMRDQEERIALLTAWHTDVSGTHAIEALNDTVVVLSLDEGQITYRAGRSTVSRTRADGREDRFNLPVFRAQANILSTEMPLVVLWQLEITGERGNTWLALRKDVTPAERYRYLFEHGDHSTSWD